MRKGFNLEVGKVRIPNVATKVGSIFGAKGKAIGEKIDKVTEVVTIVIGKK